MPRTRRGLKKGDFPGKTKLSVFNVDLFSGYMLV
jgi:hypothetical protein